MVPACPICKSLVVVATETPLGHTICAECQARLWFVTVGKTAKFLPPDAVDEVFSNIASVLGTSVGELSFLIQSRISSMDSLNSVELALFLEEIRFKSDSVSSVELLFEWLVEPKH